MRYVLEHVMDYYPYGKILREYVLERERFQTTQHERDAETGLDYRGARFYDSDLGRFLSLDPLAMEFPTESAYEYVISNPISFTDPSGQSPEGWTEDNIDLANRFGLFGEGSDSWNSFFGVQQVEQNNTRTSFNDAEAKKVFDYFIENHSRRFDVAGSRVKYGYGPGDHHDCVTALCRGLSSVLRTHVNEATIQETMATLVRLGKASGATEIGYLDIDGRSSNVLGTEAISMNGSVSELILGQVDFTDNKNKWSFFGMSLLDGYHSTLVGYNSGFNKFVVFDQIHGHQVVRSDGFNDYVLDRTQVWHRDGKKNQTTIWKVLPNLSSDTP